jgi:hypothetical protein
MLARSILPPALLAFVLISPVAIRAAEDNGIVRIKSAYSMPETIRRLKKDVADKGIMFFNEIDQSKLAADTGVTLRPSTLLVFGNPPLGTLFLTSNPAAGLDWSCLWQSSSRNALLDLQSGRGTGLARSAPRLPG